MEFYVNEFNYLMTPEEPDISFISPLQRRRMKKSDKYTLAVLHKVFCDDTENIIYSSKIGEIERLAQIIEQYSLEKEVSPALFSGSVHNYSIGLLLKTIQKEIPYNTLAACSNSISAGIFASLTSKYINTVFCYSNAENDVFEALALNISKSEHKNGIKYSLNIEYNDKEADDFKNFIELFEGKINKLQTRFFKIERIS